VDTAILSKFGVEIDMDIAKRVMLPKHKPVVDFQLYGNNFQKF